MKKLLVILLLLQGCSALEVLPGLCYTDKEGTYLCPCDADHNMGCVIRDAADDFVRIEIEELFKE